MNNRKPFSIRDRLRSFTYAFAGLKAFFSTEHNSWIELISAIGVIVLGKALHLNSYEWCFITIAISLVLIAEIFNTAIETLTDMVSPNYSHHAKKVKDLAAAAVFIAAITAVCIGVFVFAPKIFNI